MREHTKANGYFKGECHYSRTGWAWWRNPQPDEVCKVPHCTCVSCKPPKNEVTRSGKEE